MPRKKEPVIDKQQEVYSKMLFLGLIATLILVTHVMMVFEPKQRASGKSTEGDSIQSEEVLGEIDGEKQELEQRVAERAEDLQQQAMTLKDEAASSAQQVIEERKTTAEQKTQDFIYTTTLKPLIDKVHNLPSDQQEYIKENICR